MKILDGKSKQSCAQIAWILTNSKSGTRVSILISCINISWNCRKVPGWDKITAEHLTYCGPIATAAITWLINSITGIEKFPRYFKKGLIVPIPKSNKDCTIRDNNRGITVLPIFYKLFENVLLERESEWLKQQQVTSDLQGAGQQHCSSLHSSLLVQEAIAYSVNKGESVYVGLLDTKKAFDTVWVNGLIYKLHDLGMHVKT